MNPHQTRREILAKLEKRMSAQTDFDRFQEIDAQMRKAHPTSARFYDLWTERETIKNRHGGMPPQPPEDEAIRRANEQRQLAALKRWTPAVSLKKAK